MFNFSSSGGRRLWTGMKWVVYAEIGFFGAAYYVWHRMNTQQDFRKYMHESHPKVLELFYKGAEFGGFKDARQQDYATWGISSKQTVDEDL
ncbi:protein CEBPZOS-like [Lytechinus pictus]|uniref:protein CEBPZOS-like n=1 Tax=Lytechinus pictus TaxID=7653 RepID=UPI0030B9EC23